MGRPFARPNQKSNLLDVIYSAISNPGQWQQVLTQVADHLGAIGGMLIHVPERGPPLAIYGRLSEEHGALFQDRYAWNPWSCAMRNVAFDKAVVVNSLLEPHKIFRSQFYADILRPQGIVDILNSKHAALSQDGIGGFGFCLSPRGADQSHRSVQRLQRLVPHLKRALEGTLHFGRLTERTRQLARVLHFMPNPALLLDSKGRIVLANPPAEALLRANDGLSTDRSGGLQLATAFPTETAALTKTLARALAVAAGTDSALGEPLRLTRPSGKPPLLVLPIPLPTPAFELWDMFEPARVLVIIVDPVARWRNIASAVQTAFGLTPAEARVATLVSSGLSGPQVADALGVSIWTVKTHIRHCFEKTGVHSQVGLVRLFGTLPGEAIEPLN